jgi:acyl transferase domain-containing protein/NAD(P)-dependent dehydrogenase (short-subunit alcohol dehydrogenase family)/acyl carrier protein
LPVTLREPIAIVGIGCRFPGGASSPRRLWDLLTQGRCAIVEVPRDRWDHRRYYDPDPNKPGKTYVRAAGFLQEPIDSFDAAFFGISPREAAVLDPQQRLLAEVAWEGLEDAGIPADDLAGSPTGVYVGGFMLDSMLTHMGPMNRELIGPHTAVGATMTVLSNRLSFMLDLRGPSISLDTACSSSLVAVHLACQDLWSGETALALAGGVNVMFRPEIFVAMSKGKFLSADGYSKGFDSRADGYGRGEGAALVVLKRLSDALRDQDRIYALVRGTGVNQDGRTESMTAPSSRAQEALIRRVCAAAAVDPQDIQAFEAHGTGTAVGDPAEMTGLGSVSRRPDGSGPWVGSLKANIGHLEAAAGVAGMIKASLCLQHRQLPPQANLLQANPRIPFDELGLRIPRQLEALEPRSDEPLRMGVNSFGYGGTNAHCLLEQGPPLSPRAQAPELTAPALLPLSARSPGALRALAQSYADLVRAPQPAPLGDICFSAATRRSHHEYRAAFVATEDAADLAGRLSSFGAGDPAEGGASGRVLPRTEARPVFVFTGMGPQWFAMGRELYEHDALFRATLDACDEHFQRLAGWSLLAQMLQPDEASSRMARTDIAQPANMFLQLGLLALWRRAGLEPAAVIGHSAGEVAAAYAAGRFDLEQAVLVIHERSRIQAKAAGMGKMLAVGLAEAAARALIRGREDAVSIGAINGPTALTLAGTAEAIDAIAAELEARGTFNRVLKVEVPYHSPVMDGLKPELRRCLAALRPSAGTVPTYSTVLGARVEGLSYDAEYWCDNIREPTLFARAVGRLLEDGHRLFLELGPHPVLSASIKECAAEKGVEVRTYFSLKRLEPERQTFVRALAELYVAGARLDWKALYPEQSRFTPLPSYPWQRETHWQESEEALTDRRGPNEHPLLGPRISAPTPTWERNLNAQFLPCLPDHRVRGSTVVPGAAYVEMALAVRRALDLSEPHMLEDVRFENALVVSGSDEPVVRTTYDEATQTVAIHSRPRDARTSWTRHATARIRRSLLAPPEEYVRLGDLDARAADWLDTDTLYGMLRSRGLDYGPRLRGVRWLLRGESELLAGISLPASEASRVAADATSGLDPVWLDPCLQALVALLPEDDRRLYLPMGCRSVRFSGRLDPRESVFCHAQIRKRMDDAVEGEVALIDTSGRVVARLSGVECAALADHEDTSPRPPFYDWTYHHAFEEAPEADPPAGDAPDSGWVVFADEAGAGLALGQALGRAGVREVVQLARDDATRLAALDRSRIRNVAYLAGFAEPAGPPAEPEETHALLRVALALAPDGDAAIHLVTRDAQRAVADDTLSSLAASPLLGLARVVRAELPHLRTRAVDLPRGASPLDAALMDRLARELLADTAEDEVALRGTGRLVRRLRSRPLPAWEEAAAVAGPARGEPRPFFEIALDGSERRPRRTSRRPPRRGEIEIEVDSVTLTRGTATRGRRSTAAPWPVELGGTVVSIGEQAPGFAPGQRVHAILGQAPVAVGTHALLHLDRDLVLSGAAHGRLIPFLAAECALHAHGRIHPGERLLVLGNAGGIGLAAVVLGQAAGAQVAAVLDPTTDPAPEGVHAFDHRSSTLAEEIHEWTGEGGADVLLNASVDPEPTFAAILGPFARFVDAGPLAPADGLFATAWSRGASCSRVDVAAMLQLRPREAVTRLQAVLGRFERLPDLPTDALPASRASDGLRWLSERARQEGIARLTLSFAGGAPAALAPAVDERLFRADATYLVTGGFGGFGLALARWMVAEGARDLVLTGRKGAATPGARELIPELEAAGARVTAAAADVSRDDDMRALFARIDAEGPPLKGVFHTAAVLDDAPLGDLDLARIGRVMAPKARGAWILHELTKDRALDHFVLFSSVSALIGNPRQGNYVAANTFLDALAEHRAARGLSGTSIHWGVLGGTGMAADESVRAYLESLGLHAMPASATLAALKRALRLRAPQIGILDVTWATLGQAAPHLGRSPRTAHLVGEAAGGAPSEAEQLRRHLGSLALEARQGEIARFLAERLAHILQLPLERLDPTRSLSALGVDSLLSMQVQGTIREALGVEIPALDLLRAESVNQVAGTLATRLEGGAAPVPAPAPAEIAQARIEQQVNSLSESEVDTILRAMLEAERTAREASP